MDYLSQDKPKFTMKEFVIEKIGPALIALVVSGLVLNAGFWGGGLVLSAFENYTVRKLSPSETVTDAPPADEPTPGIVYAF